MKKIICYGLLLAALIACKKQSQWLDVKSSKSEVIPSSLVDLQAVLDNDLRLNGGYPGLGLLSSDHYYLSASNWQAALTSTERNAYLWSRDVYEGETGFDWKMAYQRVAAANVVLDGLQKLPAEGSNAPLYRAVQGTALFHRSMAFFQLIQGFCLPYSPERAGAMGIPLKLSPDVNERVFRSSLAESYSRVLEDLQAACQLLPASVAVKTRPSKQAGLLLLAKVLLAFQDYPGALAAAEQAAAINDELLDYNLLDAKIDFPFPTYQQKHKEVVFHATAISMGFFRTDKMLVSPALYHSYGTDDLRRVLYYRDLGATGVQFRGQYTGLAGIFAGLALNELSFIKAECKARAGDHSGAMAELNRLLVKRFRTGTFMPLGASTADQALRLVLTEREKELPFTGSLHWEDLKRLNTDSRFARTITRTHNGQLLVLPANDPRYVFPIPNDEIRFSNIPQNDR